MKNSEKKVEKIEVVSMSEAARQAKLAYQRQWRKNSTKEQKDRSRDYQRQWRKKNPVKTLQYDIAFWERKAANVTTDQKARELSNRGLSQRAISKELNISLGLVNKYLHQ